MRRAIPVLLIALLIPAGYYIASRGNDGTRNLPEGGGVVLGLDKTTYSPEDTMTLTISNGANVSVTTGYAFKLYRLEGGEWKEVPLELAFIEMAVTIEPGRSWEQKIDLSKLHLEPGRYRITKTVVLEYEKAVSKELGVEFEVAT
ncbi:hypothetical protein A3L12_07630 [Thermococcus sp. P6]|uniref:immunoglobulin-like domain-containing protein n=1 Tax=Thermococcus sp. P6 TaxID=122420 RepID=UPI000B59BE37|nr:immunoglobulin-like domain-containing protein [Thermococcus sp. P6]ASJ11176.1 hypothetical protein A3L12_07630 [Thermococcus sp. P6]